MRILNKNEAVAFPPVVAGLAAPALAGGNRVRTGPLRRGAMGSPFCYRLTGLGTRLWEASGKALRG